jgi:hypothetical protein
MYLLLHHDLVSADDVLIKESDVQECDASKAELMLQHGT